MPRIEEAFDELPDVTSNASEATLKGKFSEWEKPQGFAHRNEAQNDNLSVVYPRLNKGHRSSLYEFPRKKWKSIKYSGWRFFLSSLTEGMVFFF